MRVLPLVFVVGTGLVVQGLLGLVAVGAGGEGAFPEGGGGW